MNNVPHDREARDFFYNDVACGVQAAVADGQSRTYVRSVTGSGSLFYEFEGWNAG